MLCLLCQNDRTITNDRPHQYIVVQSKKDAKYLSVFFRWVWHTFSHCQIVVQIETRVQSEAHHNLYLVQFMSKAQIIKPLRSITL